MGEQLACLRCRVDVLAPVCCVDRQSDGSGQKADEWILGEAACWLCP